QARRLDAYGNVLVAERLLETGPWIDAERVERVKSGQANVLIDVGQQGDHIRLRELGGRAHPLDRLQGVESNLVVLVLGGKAQGDDNRLVIDLHRADQDGDVPLH